MNGVNDFEWDLDDNYYEDDLEWDDYTSKTEEINISNDDFLIHRASEIDFRTYIIREINKINSSLSVIKEVAD